MLQLISSLSFRKTRRISHIKISTRKTQKMLTFMPAFRVTYFDIPRIQKQCRDLPCLTNIPTFSILDVWETSKTANLAKTQKPRYAWSSPVQPIEWFLPFGCNLWTNSVCGHRDFEQVLSSLGGQVVEDYQVWLVLFVQGCAFGRQRLGYELLISNTDFTVTGGKSAWQPRSHHDPKQMLGLFQRRSGLSSPPTTSC